MIFTDSQKEQIKIIEENLNGNTGIPSEKKCPECDSFFQITIAGELELELCVKCGSIWFDKGELKSITGTSKDIPSEGFRLRTRESRFKCPVCSILMEENVFKEGANLLVDLCKEHGIYLQNGEFKRALELTGGK